MLGETGSISPSSMREPAHLHLVVIAAQVLQGVAGQPAGQVTGTVHARARSLAERIVEEPLGRQLRPVQISRGHTSPPTYSSPHNADGRRAAVCVEDVGAQIRDAAADGTHRPVQIGVGEQVVGDCTVVSVMPYMLTSWVPLFTGAAQPGPQRGELQRLTAEDHDTHRVRLRVLALRGNQLPEGTGRLIEHRHTCPAQQPVELLRTARHRLRHDDQPATVQQRPQISHTEKSNAKEWNRAHTSRSPKRNQSSVDVNNRTTLRCSTTTPFGTPVEPDV